MNDLLLRYFRTAMARNPTKPLAMSLFLCCSQFASATQTPWSCLETAHQSIDESSESSGIRLEQAPQKLAWINQDTISFHSLTLKRSSQGSNVFVKDDGDFKALFINDKEIPYLVLLIEPQTWMNKFGQLRVRFYRCAP